MKAVYLALCATLLLNSFQAAAGVVVGGTRLVYPGGKKEATITVKTRTISLIWCSRGLTPIWKVM